jgi:hypothetical protein
MLHSFYLSTFSPDQETGTPFAVDAIISNPATFAAEHLAEMGGIPLVMSFSTFQGSISHPDGLQPVLVSRT